MAKLSDEQKEANKRERMIDRFRALRPGTIKKQVAKEYQEMIRLEYAAKHDGWLHCVTCNKKAHWMEKNTFDAGHFLQGRRLSVIFCEDPPNCHPQCKRCNSKSGLAHRDVPVRYEQFMRDTYGHDAVERLEALGLQDHQYTREEFADLLMSYRKRIKRALEQLGG